MKKTSTTTQINIREKENEVTKHSKKNKEKKDVLKELENIEQHVEEYPHYDNWQDLKKSLITEEI